MWAKELLFEVDCRLQYGTREIPDAFEITDVVTSPLGNLHAALFVCVKTPIADGHYAAFAAYENGCRLFLAERGLALPADATVLVTEETEPLLGALAAKCYGYPARSLSLVGVTGTVGKTAVILMAGKLLGAAGHRVAVVTTNGYDLGEGFVPFLGGAPDAAAMEGLLRDLLLVGVEEVLLELSAYMLAHGVANALDFSLTLLTNLSPQHIGEGTHRSFAEYTDAKTRLFQKSAHLTIQPARGGLSTKGSVLTFGEGGDVFVHTPEGQEISVGAPLVLSYKGEAVAAISPVTGEFFAENIAAAISICLALGMPLAEIARMLPEAAPPAVLECIYEGDGKRIFLDTAYTADALSRALSSLRGSTPLCLSVLLGSVGGRAKSRRAPLGEAAVCGADVVYFTSDDPDGENPLQIYRDMTATVMDDAARFTFCADRVEAIATAVAALRSGDTLLILTKEEETQLCQGQRLPFSDRETVRRALLEI